MTTAFDAALFKVLALRGDDTPVEFLTRLAAQIEAKAREAIPAILPAEVDPPKTTPQCSKKRGGADIDGRSTTHWPPLPGQRYRGAWPPRGLVTSIPRDQPACTLPLDPGQQAWLLRYREKYPNGGPNNPPGTVCNPCQQITLAQAKAREACQLSISTVAA
jgi:hypothetical protein